MTDERIIAIGLLTRTDVDRLGATFDRLWPIDQTTDFSDLLKAIDEAEQGHKQAVENLMDKPPQR